MALLELLFGMPPERFLADHWLQRPLHVAGAVERLAELGRDPAAPQAWFDALVAELDLAFAAPPAEVQRTAHAATATASKRFDRRELVIVVLAGREHWRVARNETVAHPLAPHVAGTALHPLDRGVASGQVSIEMPADTETFVLEAGSVLYLPRGTWYETLALEESSVVAFAFKIPTWIELVINTAMVELGRDVGWRELATDDDEPYERAMQRSIDALRALRPPRG